MHYLIRIVHWPPGMSVTSGKVTASYMLLPADASALGVQRPLPNIDVSIIKKKVTAS